MAQLVKELGTKPDDPRLIPGTHMMEEKINSCKSFLDIRTINKQTNTWYFFFNVSGSRNQIVNLVEGFIRVFSPNSCQTQEHFTN